MRITLSLLTVLALAVACGKGGRGGTGGGDGGIACSSDPDCDDGIPCTVDSCGVGELCNFNPVDALCMGDTVCNPTMGCVAAMECSMDAECDDMIECTLDSCGVGGICNHMGLDALCTGGQTCDPTVGCTGMAACTTDAECNDMVDCTIDTCSVDMSCSNMRIDAMCTGAGEICHPTLGCSVPMPCTTAMDCQDGNFCNGAEICNTEFGCAPASMPRMCDDSDDCTLDTCDMTSDMCVFNCDTSRPECMCPTPGPACEGRFNVSPAFSYLCMDLIIGLPVVNVDFSALTFMNVGPALRVRPAAAHFADALADAAAPVCPNFEATHTVAGGCAEIYTVRGTFTDSDNFMGDLEIRFMDSDGFSCSATNCVAQNQMITGTRAP